MKKIRKIFLFISIILITPLLASCTKFISNPDIKLLNEKASQLMQSGDIEGAIARLESINDINPNFSQNNYNLGVAYYKNGKYEKSISALKKAVSLDKSLADAYFTIALSYQEIADKHIEELKNFDKKADSSNKIEEAEKLQEEIVKDLESTKQYYTIYLKYAVSDEEKTKIKLEMESIEEEIPKYANDGQTQHNEQQE